MALIAVSDVDEDPLGTERNLALLAVAATDFAVKAMLTGETDGCESLLTPDVKMVSFVDGIRSVETRNPHRGSQGTD
jgi:hypothetical protein